MQTLSDRHNSFLIQVLTLLFLCLLLYGQFLQNAFLLDDSLFIGNQYQHHFQSFSDFFTQTPTRHYSPLYFLINTILFQYLGSNPTSYHVISLITFYLSLVCLLALLSKVTKNAKLAFLTTLLVCVHPMNAFLVNYITANVINLANIFMCLGILSFHTYHEKHHKKFLFTALFFQVFALLCNETTLLFPAYILILAITLHKITFLKSLQKTLPFLVISLLFLILWFNIALTNNQVSDKINLLNISSPINYITSWIYLIFWYLQIYFIPYGTAYFKVIAPVNSNICFWIGLFVCLLISLLYSLLKKNRNSVISFGWLIFLTGLLPTFFMISAHAYMGFVFEPYWLHFSLLGLSLCLAALLLRTPRLLKNALISAVVIALSLCTIDQNMKFQTEERYCQHLLYHSPKNAIALASLGKIQLDRQEYTKAIATYRTILNTSHYKPYESYKHLSIIYSEINDLVRAEEIALEGITLYPEYPDTYNILGGIYAQQENYTSAEESFKKAIFIKPSYEIALLNLADTYLLQNKHEQAGDLLLRIIQNHPDSSEYSVLLQKLADVYVKQNNLKGLVELIEFQYTSQKDAETITHHIHILLQRINLLGYTNIAQKILTNHTNLYSKP